MGHASNQLLSHPKYRPDIDGLRAIAVLSVLAFHAFPDEFKGGFIGVDIFFVISGFLISTIIFENLDKANFSFSDFYARRVRRIFPALSVVMLSCLVFGWFALRPDELKQLGKHVFSGALFVSNLVLWSEVGYFDNSAESKPLLHLWSLGIEEQFYILWPVLLWLAWKRKTWVLPVALLMACVSFYLNLAGVRTDPTGTFYSPITRFWELLCGSLLAWWVLYGGKTSATAPADTPVASQTSNARNVLSYVGVALFVYGFLNTDKSKSFPGVWALLPVIGAVIMIYAGPHAWINRKILSSKPMVWVGLLSFPLYLWHWPLLSFARILQDGTPPLSFRVGALALSFLLAWLTVIFIERPFRFSKANISRRTLTLVICMTLIALAGYATYRGFWKSPESPVLQRKGQEHQFGASNAWFEGKDHWLFLGNSYDQIIAKLTLSIKPDPAHIADFRQKMERAASNSDHGKPPVFLLLGPDKSSIYPEYLPDGLHPSTKRYVNFFMEAVQDISGLHLHDPTSDLLLAKASEGLLYWKTDTHWNQKGAFVAYQGLAQQMGVPLPPIQFEQAAPHAGDLIQISQRQSFPLSQEDNWHVTFTQPPAWKEVAIPNEPLTTFGPAVVVTNAQAVSDQRIWVVGDSFTTALRPYLNATFKEVRYVGHWSQKLEALPDLLSKAVSRPDLILVVRVERSF